MPHAARERYSELVDIKLRATIVKRVGVICNNRYEGSPKAGAVKVPVRDTEVTVGDYNKKTGAEMTHGDTSFLTVTIDKDKAVNELIDGFDAETVPGKLVADRLDSAGYSMALQMEKDASAELLEGGTTLEDTAALTKTNIYEKIVDARTQLSETFVPTDGRWLLVAPETYALLLKSQEFIKASDLGDAVVQTGAVGRVAGFTVFEDTTLGENVDFVAGHPKGLSTNDYTTADKNKLAGIAAGANNYTHPAYTARTSGLYKITVDATGHVSAVTAVTKADITGLGIPSTNTTYSVATASANGLMSKTDKAKLDGMVLATDAEVTTMLDEVFA